MNLRIQEFDAMDWMTSSHQNSYIRALTSNITVFRGSMPSVDQ